MPKRKPLKIFLWTSISAALFLLIALVALFSLVYYGAFGPLPNTNVLSGIRTEQASLVYSADDEIIGKYFAKNRTNIRWEEIPEHLTNALIATEDKRFFSHDGFDLRSYSRVVFRSILLRDKSGGGGSTLTQQLIKNLYGRSDNGLLTLPVNKIREAILAARMEKIYNKEELLLLYLNSVPFGEDVFGVESASHRYFNKTVSQLRIEESAVLVGLLKANTYFNPRLHPANSVSRRNVILNLMAKEDYLTQHVADSLKQLPLALNYDNLSKRAPAGYFVYQVRKQADEILEALYKNEGKSYDIEKDGLKIYTTLNYQIQQIAAVATKEHLRRMQKLLDADLAVRGFKRKWIHKMERDSIIKKGDLDKHEIEVFDLDSMKTVIMSAADSLWHYEKMLNSAMLVSNPKTGAILCWIGGNNFRYLPFDMVLSHRQIASAFKPILYAGAFEKGLTPCTYLENKVVKYPEYNDWEPQNFDHSSTPDSLVAAWYSLAHSMNIPTVDLYFKTGWETLVTTCNKFGLPVLTTEYPSASLGAVDLSLYEIVRAYSVFASNGYYKDLYFIDKIIDESGNVIYKHKYEEPSQVLDTLTSDQITAILRRAVNEGTGTKIRTQFDVQSDLAGKTGTAQNYTNAWFMAYTPGIVVGTWVGARTPSIHFGSAYGTGSSLALPIAGYTLKKIEQDKTLRENYLVSFTQFSDTINLTDCTPYISIAKKSILEKLFKPDKGKEIELEQKLRQEKEQPEEERGVRKLFRKLFKKKSKK